MPNWLMLVLRWGGLALAVLMAATLIVLRYAGPAPEAGATPEPTAAPLDAVLGSACRWPNRGRAWFLYSTAQVLGRRQVLIAPSAAN
jgi:hypothetical protein